MSPIANTSFSQLTAGLSFGGLPDELGLTSSPVGNSEIKASGKRGSAVLMLFCSPGCQQESPSSHLVFIRRSTTVRTHRGQISFPGGRSEPDDDSPEQTAIRETVEEIGVSAADIIICGQLPVAVALDGSIVVPVVGLLDTRVPVFHPELSEVEYVFTVPWTSFRHSASQEFNFNLFGNRRSSHLFEMQGHRIWGLTAAILHSANLP